MHRSQSRGFRRLRHPLRSSKEAALVGPKPVSTDIRALNLRQLQEYQTRLQQLPENKPSTTFWLHTQVTPTARSVPTTAGQGLDVESVFRAKALALRHVDLTRHHPSAPLLNRRPARFWLRHCALPWVQLGDTIAIAFAEAQDFEQAKAELTETFGPFIPVLAPRQQIMRHLVQQFRASMARQASEVAKQRPRTGALLRKEIRFAPLYALGSLLPLALLFPREVFTLFCGIALVLLVVFAGLKLFAFLSYLRRPPPPSHPETQLKRKAELPRISILAPLYQEAEISSALLKRLRRLDYPRDRIEVLLVLEEGDNITRQAIARTRLPAWVRIIEVPIWGKLRTKPRAMNYALNFCRGEIIGVWDAEDAPQPDQLQQVAAAFAQTPTQTACFQGVLDYYNPNANWIARCFTLEYASWFRILLPGIAHMGLVVPLGGTTMFIRRQVLDDLGGWDSHNVTEDADLGVRLFRAGYRTQMLPSATYEEAACQSRAWIRQRSRWLKGFMATYLVHMRHPVQLFRDLGWRGVFGFQAFFLGTVGQFLLAPFLWSYWMVVLGLPHPSLALLPEFLAWLALSSLVFFEVLGISLAILAAFMSGRPALAPWSFTLPLYFLMGPLAVYKALYELLLHPFFWDKTSHGLHRPEKDATAHLAPNSKTSTAILPQPQLGPSSPHSQTG